MYNKQLINVFQINWTSHSFHGIEHGYKSHYRMEYKTITISANNHPMAKIKAASQY